MIHLSKFHLPNPVKTLFITLKIQRFVLFSFDREGRHVTRFFVKSFGTPRPILQIRILIGRGISDRAKMVKYRTEEPITNGKSRSNTDPTKKRQEVTSRFDPCIFKKNQ